MGLWTQLFGTDEEKAKEENFGKGRKLYYHNEDAGIKKMEENAQTESEMIQVASKRWEVVNAASGRKAADNDAKYKELMAKAYNL